MSQNGRAVSSFDPTAAPTGGEMGARTRAFDWATTPVGPAAEWPQSLTTIVRTMLGSRYAMWLGWGPEFTFFYNDAYAAMTLGPRHPWALGRSAREVWAEIWPDIGPRAESVLRTGRATWDEGLLLILERRGFKEETYHTFSYSPVPDDAGGVGGMLCVVTEDTERAVGERRLRTLRELAARTSGGAKSVGDACRLAAAALAGSARDVPFALLYLLDAGGERVTLAGAAGVDSGAPVAPAAADLAAADPWPFRAVAESGRAVVVSDLAARLGAVPHGPWPEPPQQAVVLPLVRPGQPLPDGFLVAGVSPRRPLDDGYRGFLDLLAGQVATSVASARAYEDERRRAEALAELDRAKTAFFSNVSHEFRTPLTLMLGPLEDLLGRPADRLPPADRELLEVARRNGRRLQRLVTTLLDFSRIEAGRVRATYEPTDLAAFTADLASNFRSACERAGLALTVDCPPLAEPAYVDRAMWEQIVLNLLSNAFKFTLAGGIGVTVRPAGRAVELRVRDTGTGVPADEMPRLFERFHRVENARGRTHEGSGIGLALVQELVKLHGGAIAAESAVGVGTTFTVTLPLGSAHLPADRVASGGTLVATAAGAGPFVDEALRWLPDGGPAEPVADLDDRATPALGGRPAAGERPRVLVADDNADMRGYVARLLAEPYAVEAVSDGAAALAAARRRPPDLILSDVMMPRLDGFGLIRELRADPRAAGVPVILLSARAGEESRVEGVRAGADDYLVKPFGARELLARVAAQLQLARLRREAGESLRASEERFRTLFETMGEGFAIGEVLFDAAGRAADLRHLEANPAFERHTGLRRADVLGRTVRELFPATAPEWFERYERVVASGVPEHFEARLGPLGRQFEVSAYKTGPAQFAIVFFDVTDRKRAEDALRTSEQRYRALVTSSADVVYRMSADWAEMFPLDGRNLVAGNAEPIRGWMQKNVPAFEHARVTAAIDRAVAHKQPFELEHRVLRPDGTLGWTHSRAAPLLGADGEIVEWLGTARDVTDQRRASEELARLAEALRLAVAAADLGTWEWDPATDAMRLSDRAAELYGVDPARPLTRESLRAAQHPDDRARVRAAARTAAADRADYDIEYRLTRPGGEPVWLSVRGRGVYDAAGTLTRMTGVVQDVTARKRAEERLAEAHQFLQASLDALPSHIAVLDGRGVILAVNAAWRRFADENRYAGRDYGVGASYVEAYAPTAGTGECVEAEMVAGLTAVLAGARPDFEFEYPCHAPDRRRWFLLRATRFRAPGPVRVVVSHDDITARRLAEESLRAGEARFRLAAEAVNGIIYEYDIAAGRVERTRGLFEVLGYRPDEVPASADWWFDQIHPDDRRDESAAVRAAARTGDRLLTRYRARHRDGRWLHLEDRSVVLADAAGAPVRVIGCTLDVTQRVEAEQALKEADRRKDEFLATLAHELRNPLAPIRNGLQIMRLSGGERAAVERARAMMERQLAQLVHLVDDLLDLSRISRGKIELRTQRVELAGVVRHAVETCRPAVDQAGHELTVTLPPEPVYVDADTTRLSQVIANLLTNAAKYTDRGGRVDLTVRRDGGAAVVSVRDTGIGIPAHLLPRVFEMFTPVDRNLERGQGGLGIGLSIVKRLVEMHGGTVAAFSGGAGRGSEFVVRLPAAAAAGSDRPADGNGQAPRGPRRRVLVVDDNRDAAESLAVMLDLMGNETRTAHDGLEALEAAPGFRPDVIVLDIGMPRLNGYDTARRIRQQPWGRGVVLVALTGWGQDDDRKKSREAGFDRHLTKPVDPAQLERVLAEAHPAPA
jgi:PAS domain S-box-containing protein